MSASVSIYTANMGGHDDPPRRQAPQDVEVDWWYITDDPSVDPGPPWRVLRADGLYGDPNLDAKWWKCHPITAGDHAIWIDANMEITSPSFAREAVEALYPRRTVAATVPATVTWDDGTRVNVAPDPVLAVWQHPRRDCIYDEARATIGPERQGDKYDDAALLAQVDRYRAEGHPEHAGLYACGTVVWTPDAWPVGRAWMDECVEWTPQDQLSFPVVCRRLGVEPAVFPIGQIDQRLSRARPWLANRWLRIHPHAAAA